MTKLVLFGDGNARARRNTENAGFHPLQTYWLWSAFGPEATLQFASAQGTKRSWRLEMRAALLCLPLALSAACATVTNVGSQATILAVDNQQREMVAASDVSGLARLAHPNLRINAPGGRVLTREQFLANMRNGEIAAEGFERTAEDVTLSGNLAVVMGRETFTPAATSELGRSFGAKPLQRRYTNIYIWQHDRWLWLARHANVLAAPHP